MTAKRRLAQVEASLTPQALVLHWLEEVQAYPSLVDYTRTILDLPVGEQPLNRMGRAARDAAKASAKGQSADAADRAARRAEGDVAFLFSLVMELNESTLEDCQVDRLWGHLLTIWLQALVGGAYGEPGAEQPSQAELATWETWFRCVGWMEVGIRVRAEAKKSLEGRYLGGHDSLFTDVGGESSALEGVFARLTKLRDGARAAFASGGWTPDGSETDLDVEAAVPDRARFLADNARGPGVRPARRGAPGRGDHGRAGTRRGVMKAVECHGSARRSR